MFTSSTRNMRKEKTSSHVSHKNAGIKQTRTNYTAAMKTEFVLIGLQGKEPISSLCRRRGVNQSLYYRWRKQFIDLGKQAFINGRVTSPTVDEQSVPRDEERHTKEFLSRVQLRVRILRLRCALDAYSRKTKRFSSSDKMKIIRIVRNTQLPVGQALKVLGIARSTFYRWFKRYRDGDLQTHHESSYVRLKDRESVRNSVFKYIHSPPSDHNINRTSWKMQDLKDVLKSNGVDVGLHTIRAILRDAGYRWLKARKVLASNDPAYKVKLARIQNVLKHLRTDEAFFSIDEFGPFSVKIKGGRKLVAPGESFTIPQRQKSKGCLIVTASLELSRNQVTHFYSKKKNTVEMIKMLDLLVERYRGFKKLWLSWDAASWHMGHRLYDHIEAVNQLADATGNPAVSIAPLPAGAQFLNVIESVFSGMARSIIHNSDYNSTCEVKSAIDRYLEERNTYFRINPQRAGKKIWGKERVISEFRESNNCKNPTFR